MKDYAHREKDGICGRVPQPKPSQEKWWQAVLGLIGMIVFIVLAAVSGHSVIEFQRFLGY